jgi:hypothetical protein
LMKRALRASPTVATRATKSQVHSTFSSLLALPSPSSHLSLEETTLLVRVAL